MLASFLNIPANTQRKSFKYNDEQTRKTQSSSIIDSKEILVNNFTG